MRQFFRSEKMHQSIQIHQVENFYWFIEFCFPCLSSPFQYLCTTVPAGSTIQPRNHGYRYTTFPASVAWPPLNYDVPICWSRQVLDGCSGVGVALLQSADEDNDKGATRRRCQLWITQCQSKQCIICLDLTTAAGRQWLRTAFQTLWSVYDFGLFHGFNLFDCFYEALWHSEFWPQ